MNAQQLFAVLKDEAKRAVRFVEAEYRVTPSFGYAWEVPVTGVVVYVFAAGGWDARERGGLGSFRPTPDPVAFSAFGEEDVRKMFRETVKAWTRKLPR